MPNKQDDRSGRLFRNPKLEALTRTHIAIPLVIFYGSAATAFIIAAAQLHLPATTICALGVSGGLLFTLVEYGVHRWLYHLAPRTHARARFQFVIHGVHHEHPRDKRRLAMPPALGLLLAVLFFYFFWLLMGRYGIPFGGGFLAGYASYLLIHYSIHAYKPPRNFLRALWRHHHLHHYGSDERAFGVSSPLWDMVFGTMPEIPRQRKAGN